MDLRFLRLLKQQPDKTVLTVLLKVSISAHGKALPSADSRPESLEKKVESLPNCSAER